MPCGDELEALLMKRQIHWQKCRICFQLLTRTHPRNESVLWASCCAGAGRGVCRRGTSKKRNGAASAYRETTPAGLQIAPACADRLVPSDTGNRGKFHLLKRRSHTAPLADAIMRPAMPHSILSRKFITIHLMMISRNYGQHSYPATGFGMTIISPAWHLHNVRVSTKTCYGHFQHRANFVGLLEY